MIDKKTQRPQPEQQPQQPSHAPAADPVIRRGTGISREDVQRGTYVPGEKEGQEARSAGTIGRG